MNIAVWLMWITTWAQRIAVVLATWLTLWGYAPETAQAWGGEVILWLRVMAEGIAHWFGA